MRLLTAAAVALITAGVMSALAVAAASAELDEAARRAHEGSVPERRLQPRRSSVPTPTLGSVPDSRGSRSRSSVL